MDKILENIIIVMKQKNVTPKELCEKLGKHEHLFTDWKSGKSQSYKKMLPEIGNILKEPCIIFYNIPVFDKLELTEMENDLVMLARSFTEQERELVKNFIINISIANR